VEIGAICPDVTEDDVKSTIPVIHKDAPQNRPQVSSAKTQQQEPGQKKSILDRALDAMESAVTSEKQPPAEEAQKEQQLKKKVWMVYGGVVGVVLIIALILRGLIH
jgi:hypothetical protein